MTAWTDECPICWRPFKAHNDETGRLHYTRWQKRMGEPYDIVEDAVPSMIGEFDTHTNFVIHRARG